MAANRNEDEQWNFPAFPGTGTNVQAGTERYTSLWDCAFNALGLLVLQTPPDERTSTRITGPTRHVLVWLTVMFLLITTSYGSGLASILTIPRYIVGTLRLQNRHKYQTRSALLPVSPSNHLPIFFPWKLVVRTVWQHSLLGIARAIQQ